MTESGNKIYFEEISEVITTRRVIQDEQNSSMEHKSGKKCGLFARRRLARVDRRLANLLKESIQNSEVPQENAVLKGKEHDLVIDALCRRMETAPESYEADQIGRMIGKPCARQSLWLQFLEAERTDWQDLTSCAGAATAQFDSLELYANEHLPEQVSAA